MAYQVRDWDNTGNDVTKEDFKRIENGIETNDLEIAKQKNATIPGTLARQIADMKDSEVDGSLQKQINVLKGEELVNPSVHTDIRTYIASLKKEHATYVSNTPTLTNITGIPVGITSFFIVVDGKQSSSFGAYYCKITLSDLVDSNVQYVCNVYNNTTYTTWTRIATQTMLQSAIDALNL